MNSLDTVELRIPQSCVFAINPECFTNEFVNNSGYYEVKSRKLKKLYMENMFGVSRLKFDSTGNLIMTFSAKVLRVRYFEGINLKNIEHVFSNINSYKYFEIDIPEAMKLATVGNRLDVCAYFNLRNDIQKYFIDLNLAVDSETYICRKFGSGIQVEPHLIEITEILKMYGKEPEMDLPRNAELKKMTKHVKLTNGYKIELQHYRTKAIRKNFEIPSGDIFLSEILNSKTNVLLKSFQNRFAVKDLPLIPEDIFACKGQFAEMLKILGWFYLFEKFKGSISAIIKLINVNSTGKGNSTLMKNLRQVQTKWVGKKLFHDYSLLKEIEDELSKL